MDILKPDLKLFKEKYDSGIKQVLFTSFAADVHTPISSLLKLEKEKYLFLFESVERGSQKGRYSVIGLKPDLIWECKDGISKIKKSNEDIITKKINSDPLDNLRKIIEENKLKIPHNLPSIACGLFGYLGYEMIKYFENVEMIKKDKLDLPESIFIRPSLTLVFDNVNDKLYISKIISPNKKKALETFKLAESEIIDLIQKITRPLKKSNLNLHNLSSKVDVFKNVKTNTTYLEFKKMIEKAKKYIFEGEIFQVVLSRLFKVKIKSSPVSIYRALRHLNPSPYLFFMNFKDFVIVGSSPEILIKLEDDKVTIRPIAGTRKRGKTKQEDKKLEKDLLSDPKEISEHLMLLDLGRNDISRVTDPGTVKVTSKMYIEYFSHVMHIVSNIEGKINKKKIVQMFYLVAFPLEQSQVLQK